MAYTNFHTYKRISRAYAAMLAGLAISLAGGGLCTYAVSIETDEYGVAYVLKEDGSRDYSNVPALPTTDDAAVSQGTIIDSNRHDIGNNGPTKDQGLVGIPEGMTKETYEALGDKVINWSEIPDIIEQRNPTYVKYYKQADASLATMRAGYEDFSYQMGEQLRSLDETAENLKLSEVLIGSLPEGQVSYNGANVPKTTALESLNAALNAASSGRRSISSALTSTRASLYYGGKSIDTVLKPVKNQLTATVETLIISYKSLEANRELVAEQAALYESLYDTYKSTEAQSLSTKTQTDAALNQLNAARKTLAELDAGLLQLKQNILIQCGYDADADVTIADIPDADRSYLDGRDIAADRKKATDGNPSVISAGKLSNYQYSSDGMKSRDLGENEARGKANAAFDAIYNELQRELILADSAETSLKKAELNEQAAKVKYELGMLSRSEYAALKLQLAASRTSAELTRLNLIQAVNNYSWAMEGVMSIE